MINNNAAVSASTNANTDYSTTMMTASSPINLNHSVAVTQLSGLTKGGSNSSNSQNGGGILSGRQMDSQRSIINQSEQMAQYGHHGPQNVISKPV